jgi:hypothetical protein
MMEAQLDMNSNRIVNLLDAVNLSEPVTLRQATQLAGVTVPLTKANVGGALWPQSAIELSHSVTPSDLSYDYSDIRRYGANNDGSTDCTAAFEQAALLDRCPIRFGRETAWTTGVLGDYSNFYILRDAQVYGMDVIGPANLTSDGTQDYSIISLGDEPDSTNGARWRWRKVEGINFSGKLRADDGIRFGDNDTSHGYPANLAVGWEIKNCYGERMNRFIVKPHGNFGQIITNTSCGSGNYGYWARGYPIRSELSSAEASGQTILSVADTALVSVNDVVRVLMDDTTTHKSTVTAVSSTTVTIADPTADTAAAGNWIKFYHPDDAVPATLSHVGADYIVGGEWAGNYVAAFYLDGQNAQGTGANVLQSAIIEGNPGFGIFVRDYNNAYTALTLKNCWFESNGKDANTTITDADGIALTQTPGAPGSFNLNGALISAGSFSSDTVVTNGPARQLSFTSDANESGDTYTITGTGWDDAALVENISGPNTTTVNSVNSFRTVTSITTDGAGTGNITIGITNAVDFEDGVGPRTPQDIQFEKVDNAYIFGSQIRLCTFKDSNVVLDYCTFESGITEITIANNEDLNHVIARNAHVAAFGEDVDGAGDLIIESVSRVDREVGTAVSRMWRLPNELTPITAGGLTGGTILESDRGDSGIDWNGVSPSADLSRDGYVQGNTYPTATQYTFTASGEWVGPAVTAVTGTTAGKWYVATMELKVDSGLANIGSLKFGSAYTFTRGGGESLLVEGKWRTIGIVGKLGDSHAGGIVRPWILTNSGGSAQITWGATQIVEFDDAQEAYDYYNRNVHVTQLSEGFRVRRTNSAARATTTTTLTDDELDFAAALNFSQVEQLVNVDFKFQDAATVVYGEDTGSGTGSLAGTANIQRLWFEGVFQSNATTGGTVDIGWGQGTSNAYNTLIKEGSWMKVTKLHDEN